MLVLGIETTCDESAASIVKDGKEILSNVLFSQTQIQERYQGVFPEIASRLHCDKLLPVIEEAIQKASITPSDIDLIAVSTTPGLLSSITIGLTTAKTLALCWRIPLVGVNHVQAHLYASIINYQPFDLFPALGVVVSGGHTFLAKLDSACHYTILSSTVDDAIGEAFDKVGRLLDLPYPAGPHIEKLAQNGSKDAFNFKAGYVKKDPYAFSFSGLKTNVMYTVQELKNNLNNLTLKQKCDISASFQHCAFRDIVKKTLQCYQKFDCQSIILGGGVTQNQYLRALLTSTAETSTPIFFPKENILCLDNAAMIAGLGYHLFLESGGDPFTLEAKPKSFLYSKASV